MTFWGLLVVIFLLILGLLVIISVIIAVLGLGFTIAWLFTAIIHAFKESPPPRGSDYEWSPDQAEEAE